MSRRLPLLVGGGAMLLASAVPSGRSMAHPETPPEVALTATAVRGAVEALASVLERMFVSASTGRLYAAHLRSRSAGGGFDGIADRSRLASMLSDELQQVAPEGHLRVFAGPAAARPGSAPPQAVEEARWLAPSVAYLRPTIFMGSADGLAAIEGFLVRHAGARSVIIDMRVHRGGGLVEMDRIFAALFAQPTRLLVLDTRASAGVDPFTDGPTLKRTTSAGGVIRREHWAVPPVGGGSLSRARVYVLTSGFTVSAGEHLALALKRTRRALLIGAGTQGAGNFGSVVPIGAGMSAFVPVGRTYDPDTGEGWEGTGVQPHVQVPPRRALVGALERAGLSAREAESLSAEVAPSGSMELRPDRPAPRRTPRR